MADEPMKSSDVKSILESMTLAVNAIDKFTKELPQRFNALEKSIGTPNVSDPKKPFNPKDLDIAGLISAQASKSMELNQGADDPFRLTGTERYDPAMIITRSLETGLADFFKGMSRFDEDLAKSIQAIKDDFLATTRKKFGPKDDKKAQSEFDKFIQTPEAQEEMQATLDDAALQANKAENNRLADMMGGAVRIPIKMFGDYVLKVVASASKQNQESLKFNKRFAEAVAGAGGKIDSLPGSLAEKMGVLFDFEKEGLNQVGVSTLALAARMKITGQNSGALIQLNKKLILQGGLTLSQNEILSQSLDDLSKSGQITADLIVGSIAKLDDSLDVLFVAGSTDKVSNAMAELTKKFPSLGEDIGTFAELFATADIGQAHILQSMQGLQDFTSGQITTGEQFQKIIEGIAKSSKRFTGGMEANEIVGTRAMIGLVGPLGMAAERLQHGMDTFNANITDAGTTSSRIFSNLTTAFNTILAPFEEVINNVITFFQRFGEVLITIDNALKDTVFSVLRVSNLMGVVLVRTILTKLLPAFNKVGLSTLHGGLRDMIQGVGSKMGDGLKLAAGGALRGFFAGALRLLMGPLGIGLLVWQGIKMWSDNQKEKEDAELKATAKNTADLVKLTRVKEREEFGSSRFERLTNKLLQDSMFTQAAQESLLSRGLPQLIEAAQATAAGVTSPTTIRVPVPVR